MTDAPLRKRDRRPEALQDSIDVPLSKRLRGEETDSFLHILQLNQTLADDEEEEFAPSEELIDGVMRSLEEEIAATRSTSDSSVSGNNSVASDSSTAHEGETVCSAFGLDLSYLLKASDDELGIPPSPVLDMKDQVCLSRKETPEGLSESPDLKSIGENWHFEDDFESYKEFAVHEDPWDEIQLMKDYYYMI